MTGFETVHRDLRAAEEATRGASLGMSVTHVAAAEALWKFHERTGPLVDDLVTAARELQKFGEHDGPCVYLDNGKCSLHVLATEERRQAVNAALVALDEAARG